MLEFILGAIIGGSLTILYMASIMVNPRDDWKDKE